MKKLILIVCSIVFIIGCKPEEIPETVINNDIESYINKNPVKKGEDYRIGHEIIDGKEVKVLYIKTTNGKFKKVVIKD